MENGEKLGSFESIDFESVTSHTDIVKKIVWEEKKTITSLLAVLIFFLAGYGFVIQQAELLLGGLLISLLYIAYAYFLAAERYLRELAKKNNLGYQKFIPLEDFKSNIKNTGGSKANPNNVVTGNYREKRARLFYYKYTVQRGKNSVTYPFTVFEIFFDDITFPHTLLHFKGRSVFGAQRHGAKRKEEIEVRLEDRYRKLYNLYIEDGYGIEAMQIFTVDFLDFLVDEKFNYSIELSENRLYVYTSGNLFKKSELKELFATVSEMLERMTPILKRLKKDFNTLRETYNR